MPEHLDVTIDPRNTRGWPQTHRQLEWAMHYVIDGDTAFDAAVKAGYSRTTAKSKSCEFVRKLQPFLLHLQRRKNGVAEAKLNVTAELVVQGLAALAFPDSASYYVVATLKGGVQRVVGRPPYELTARQWAAIKRWTVVTHEGMDGVVLDYVYTFIDRVKPLMGLAKCLGLFSEKIQVELLQARSAHARQDYTNVSNEALSAAIDELKRMKADLAANKPSTPETNLSQEARRLLQARVMSSAA